MSAAFAFFKFVAKATLNCAGFGVAGDVVGEVLPEVARAVYERWARGRSQKELRDDLEAVARTGDAEARRLAALAVEEEAPYEAEKLQLTLVSYLAQIPAAVRQTQRRVGDPSGRSVCANLILTRPADVMALLPARLPRFEKGHRPAGFPDWQLDELLGIGGFGEVWKAHNAHLHSEPPVALKFCLDEAAARMLRNEVALLDRVRQQGRHPGIVALLDTALNSDPPCLKYEYVAGGDLTGLIRHWHEGPREEIYTQALAMMRQLAEIVAFAHRLSPPIVHRDLKPANVLLQNEGTTKHTKEEEDNSASFRVFRVFRGSTLLPKIADFGIGAIVSSQGLGTLATQALLSHMPTALRGSCTPLYASPQQVRGDDPHPRDDVFALGVIWFQMLTGRLTEQPGADWREELVGCQVPEAVIDLLGRCLAVREERRLPDAGALADELRRLGEPAAEAIVDVVEDDVGDSDDPRDLAAQVQHQLTNAQVTLSKAVQAAEVEYDYARAVRLLDGLPAAFRDNGLLDLYRLRRDRVTELRAGIRADATACRFAGLRDRIDELLYLTPRDDEMRRLAAKVPWEPGTLVTNAFGMRLVLIQPGAFGMGSPRGEVGRHKSEGPVHEVQIANRFYLGVHPVTQEQYQRLVGVNPAHFHSVPGHDARTFPVENVTWADATEFCRALSALPEERQRRRAYRLPTEAEWEYACRAGTSTPFAWGASLSSAQANFDGRHPYGHAAKGEYLGRTSAVGTFPANAWGLHDLHGNVWEWCQDWFAEAYYRECPRRDPQGPETGDARVLRGGCWQNHGRMLRSGNRDWVGPAYRGFTVGFRVVMEVRPAA